MGSGLLIVAARREHELLVYFCCRRSLHFDFDLIRRFVLYALGRIRRDMTWNALWSFY